MRSKHARLVGLVALAACGPGVKDLSLEVLPLLTVRGQLDVSVEPVPTTGPPLYGALAWVAVPPVNETCIRYADSIGEACPDPFAVFLAHVQGTAPVAADGSFTIELFELPPAFVMVGTESERIGYGTMLAFEDNDRDGELGVPVIQNLFGVLPGFPDRPGGGIGGSGDRIVGASFHHQFVPQARLVLREGGFDGDSYFYRPCRTPPRGFSVLSASSDFSTVARDQRVDAAYAAYAGGQTACETRSAAAAIEIERLEPGEEHWLQCGPSAMPRITPPMELEGLCPQIPETPICAGNEYVHLFENGECTEMMVVALQGCFTSLYCENPDWSEPAPSCWPC